MKKAPAKKRRSTCRCHAERKATGLSAGVLARSHLQELTTVEESLMEMSKYYYKLIDLNETLLQQLRAD